MDTLKEQLDLRRGSSHYTKSIHILSLSSLYAYLIILVTGLHSCHKTSNIMSLHDVSSDAVLSPARTIQVSIHCDLNCCNVLSRWDSII